MGNAQPTLLIAWAGADWKLIRPLLDGGLMPNLREVLTRGVHGNLTTLQPQSRGLLWTSLITGQRADVHGVLTPLRVSENQDVVPVSSADRRVPALWEMLDRHGQAAHAVNWPYSHPAEPGAGVRVGELFAQVSGMPGEHRSPLPGCVAPAERAADLAGLRVHPGELDWSMLEWFVPEARQVEQSREDLLGRLGVALARCATTHAVATELLEQDTGDLLAVCYDPLDWLGWRFLALHPPRLSYVPESLFRRYRNVVPRMLQLLDLQLGRLLQLAGPDARVIIVSERGVQSDHLRPQSAEVAVQHKNAPWVRDQGVLIMAGPGIRRDSERIEGAGLLDIVPTLLALMRLPPGQDMPGRVLAQVLSERPRLPMIGSWGKSDKSRVTELTEAEAEALWRDRIALGDIGPVATDSAESVATAEGVQRDRWFNLALVHLGAQRPQRALPVLRKLHEATPDNERITIHYARCLHALGEHETAGTLMRQVAEGGPDRPREYLILSQIHQAEGNPAKALASLFRAEQANPAQPALHCRIGQVYLQMQRWDDAARAFGKTLDLDPDFALAHHGLAIVHLASGRPQEAADAALTATGLQYQAPQAHFHLGLALIQLGRVDDAIQAFETSLSQHEANVAAHQWLARIHRDQVPDPAKAERHQARAVQLQVAEMLR